MKLVQIFENKLDYIAKAQGLKILQRLRQNREATGLQDDRLAVVWALNAISHNDPTNNKYLQWMVNQYIKGQYRIEDLSRVQGAIIQFEQSRNRLPKHDINAYSFSELEDIFDNVTPETFSTNFKHAKDIEIIYNGPDGILAIPETQAASCELGKNTRWCTAYNNENNAFDTYNEHDPLYVWSGSDGKKYQFHFPTLQAMDAKDKPLSASNIISLIEKYPAIRKLFVEKSEMIGDLVAMWSEEYGETADKQWVELANYLTKDK